MHFVFHAAGAQRDVWSDVNVRPCDQQDRKDLCWFGIHKCILIDALDGNRKTARPCDPAWLCGTV